MASYEAIIGGLQAALEQLPGLGADPLVLDHEPTSPQQSPMIYLLFDTFEDVSAGQVEGRRYEIIARLLVHWQDNREAEVQLWPFLPGGTSSISARIRDDAYLGGVLESGFARVTGAEEINANIGGTEVRAVDFTIAILDKSPE